MLSDLPENLQAILRKLATAPKGYFESQEGVLLVLKTYRYAIRTYGKEIAKTYANQLALVQTVSAF